MTNCDVLQQRLVGQYCSHSKRINELRRPYAFSETQARAFEHVKRPPADGSSMLVTNLGCFPHF